MVATNEYKIKVIDKMFKIVDVIENENRPLGVNEIARKAFLNGATTFRILKALMDYGWVYQDTEEKYSSGYKLCSAFNMGKFYFILKDVSYSIMRRLTDIEGEVLNLSIRENEMGVLLQQSRTSKIVDYVMKVDSRSPLYATAGGKILLSELPETILDNIIGLMDFTPFTERTITNPASFLENLKIARERGFATDEGESLHNTSCIGVPVRGPSNEIIAALSFSGILNELTYEKEMHYYKQLSSAAKEISDQMFHLYKGRIPRADNLQP